MHFDAPFTANRQFKANPRLLARAKGMYYTTSDGREVLDGVAGLWCVNRGTKPPRNYRGGHPTARDDGSRTDLSGWVTLIAFERDGTGWRKSHRRDWTGVFFTNSGSESVDTALKIAIGYQRDACARRGPTHRARLTQPREGLSRRLDSAAYRSAVWSITARSSLIHAAGRGLICRIHLPISNTTRSRAAFRSGWCTWQMNWNAWSPCTMPRPLQRSSWSRHFRLRRRGAAADGLFETSTGNLRQARHPAGYLRRSDHRLWPRSENLSPHEVKV